MAYTCDIFLKQTTEGVYKAGQTIEGALKITVFRNEQFESIAIVLIGKAKCSWTESVGGASGSRTRSYSAKETIVSLRHFLVNSHQSEYVVLQTGEHSYGFNLNIPKDIPSSIHIDDCNIKYQVVAEIIRPSFFRTTDEIYTDITVYGNVQPCSQEPYNFEVRKDILCFGSGKYFHIKGVIEKTVVKPGDNIEMQLVVENIGNVKIKGIQTEMVKQFTFFSSENHVKVVTETFDETVNCSDSINGDSINKLTCVIPTLPSMYSIQHTNILNGNYKVRITVKLPFPYKNYTLEAPVVIGENGSDNTIFEIDDYGIVLPE